MDEIPHLAAVLEHLRRLTALERGAEDRRDAGVRRVSGHPGAVDIVIAQPDRRTACLARPRRGVVLLSDLARGVGAPRVQPCGLRDRRPSEDCPTDRARVLEVTCVQRLCAPRPRGLRTVRRTRVATLAVDDHRGREDEPVDAGRVHAREQRGRAQVVVGCVRRQIGRRDTGSDDGRLMADDVDAPQQVAPGPVVGLPHVEAVSAGGCLGRAVRGGVHPVDADHLVALLLQAGSDRRADEASRPGQQDPHRAGAAGRS